MAVREAEPGSSRRGRGVGRGPGPRDRGLRIEAGAGAGSLGGPRALVQMVADPGASLSGDLRACADSVCLPRR